MQIRFDETDIRINRSANTKGAYQCYSFQIPPCFSPQKKSIRPSQSIMERPLPPRPTASPPLHQWLLYLIEIETSIKIGLLRGTKASDIPQWRILLWVKPLDLITLIFHLRKRNSIGASNYSQVGFAPSPTSSSNIFVLPCPQLCLTNLARVCYVRYVPQSDTVCLRALALASWRDGGITVAKKMSVSEPVFVYRHMANISVCLAVCRECVFVLWILASRIGLRQRRQH